MGQLGIVISDDNLYGDEKALGYRSLISLLPPLLSSTYPNLKLDTSSVIVSVDLPIIKA